MSFIFVTALESLPDGGVHEIQAVVGGEDCSLLVLRHGEQVRVFHNVCPHAGRSLELAPGRFLVDQGLLMCAAHGACFTIPQGECVSGPCRGQTLTEVPSQLRDGQLWIDPS